MKDKDVKHKPYRSIVKSVQSIVKAEGWRGLQKGLSAQICFQFTMNSVRLGIYQTLDDYGFLKRDENGKLSTLRCIAVGGFSGFVGVTMSCPFYMIKTQLQVIEYNYFLHHIRITFQFLFQTFHRRNQNLQIQNSLSAINITIKDLLTP